MKMEYMIIGKLKIFTYILKALVEVYDRMGNMVFRRRNYINSESVAFNGFSKDGRRLPSGTYYYILNLENSDDVFKGSLTIVR